MTLTIHSKLYYASCARGLKLEATRPTRYALIIDGFLINDTVQLRVYHNIFTRQLFQCSSVGWMDWYLVMEFDFKLMLFKMKVFSLQILVT